MPTPDFSVLAVAVAFVAAWEFLVPRRLPGQDLRRRWLRNLGIWAINVVLVRSLFPVLGIGTAILAAQHGIGLLNLFPVPGTIGVTLTVLLLDLAKYIEHRAFHHLAFLWRVHRMHHTDVDFDFTVGFRFHPIEAVLSVAWTFTVIALLGPAPAGVAIWQTALLINGVFAHANARMPGGLDRAIRLFTVTPDMHRVHHSTVWQESASNLGSVFPWWDRLFGTYIASPKGGLVGMHVGIEEFRERRYLTLPGMLLHPVRPLTRPVPGLDSDGDQRGASQHRHAGRAAERPES